MNIQGEGSVVYDKKRCVWYAKVPVGRTTSGSTAYRKRTALNRRDAERVRRQLLQEREEFRTAENQNINKATFQSFAEQHLEGEARQEVREVTRRGYIYLLETLAYPKFGSMPIQEIKSTELSALLLELRKTHSASQVNHLRAAMSRVFQSALNHQVIDQNPVRRTKRMRSGEGDKTHSHKPWSLDECRRAMTVAIDTEMDLFIHLAILTGARMGEMMGLKWGDIDFNAKTLRIQRTLVELRGSRSEGGVKGYPSFSPPKTPKSMRKLTFGQQLNEALQRHKTVQVALRNESGDKWVESDCVFTTVNGTPVWPSNFSARYRRFLKENELRHVNIHSIRHSFAQNALELGIDLASISRALGHASLQITLDIYARDSNNLQDAATEGLAKWFEHQ